MRTWSSAVKTNPNNHHLNSACTRLLPILLLLLIPAASPAAISGDYEYTDNGDTTCTITDYLGPGGNITIPDTLNDLTVTIIGEWAFRDSNLTSVTIPDSVTIIEGWGAFANCTGLTSVTIGNGVTNIGMRAFYGCTNLTNVMIGNSVTTIGDDVFYNCSNLTDINIPASVTNIQRDAFWGCSGLQAFTVDELNSVYSSLDGVLFSKNQEELIRYPLGKAGSYTIPNSVTCIQMGSFRDCTRLSGSLIIPDSVITIEWGAFDNCTALTNITISENVISVENYAFYGCTGLLGITVDEQNSTYSSLEEVFFDKDQTILIQYPPAKVGAYVIPGSVTSIQNGAFENSTGLTYITIHDGITDIGPYTFQGCNSLQGITVDGFNPSYSSLDAVLFNKDQTELLMYPPAKAGCYIIPDSVTAIGDNSFSGCFGLTNVIIPTSVNSLGLFAFAGCSNLLGLYFKGDVPFLGQGAFLSVDNAVIYYIPGTADWGEFYGGLPTAEWLPSPTDVDLNYEVDIYDFSVLAAHWLQTGCDGSNDWCGWADFDQNGAVDPSDLALLIDDWLFGLVCF